MGDVGPRWALGLMSGTSMDGVDAAAILTDGETITAFGPTAFTPYGDGDRRLLRQALADAARMGGRDDRPGVLAEAERMVTERHVEACRALLAVEGAPRIDVVGFHGQTVLHAPDRGLTVQIGDARGLGAALGLRVVHDYRSADVAAGGQGAPLVPVFHRALLRRAGARLPAAFVNVGGVANVTLIDEDGGMLAFDTGPGNALVDDLILDKTEQRYDENGAFAARGRVNDALVHLWMSHPYFEARPPKSLDRQTFRRGTLEGLDGLAFLDQAATLTAFSAAAIARGLAWQSPPAETVVVSGGGAHNGTMMSMLAHRAAVHVQPADALGLSGDFLEAQAFGYLAVRRERGLPVTFPGTTGVAEPMPAGVVTG